MSNPIVRGRRRGRVRPAKPMGPEMRARLADAPVAVHRALILIATTRVEHGHGPDPRSVWAVYWNGHPRRWPRAGRTVTRTKALADGTTVQVERPEIADIRPTLELLRPYGIRWVDPIIDVKILPEGRVKVTPTGGIGLTRPVYNVLRPVAVEILKARGTSPKVDAHGRPVRYRIPKVAAPAKGPRPPKRARP